MTQVASSAILTGDLASWLKIDSAAFESNIRQITSLLCGRAGCAR